MVRFYRLARVFDKTYDLVDYFLDPSEAANRALELAKKMPRSDYLIVSQIDVYPATSELHEFLRVDGQA